MAEDPYGDSCDKCRRVFAPGQEKVKLKRDNRGNYWLICVPCWLLHPLRAITPTVAHHTEWISEGFPEVMKTNCWRCKSPLKDGFYSYTYGDYWMAGCRICIPTTNLDFTRHGIKRENASPQP